MYTGYMEKESRYDHWWLKRKMIISQVTSSRDALTLSAYIS